MLRGRAVFSLCLSILSFSGAALSGSLMADETRLWTDSTGKFKVEASFVEKKGDSVVLAKEDGKKLTIPIAKLCEADRSFLEGLEAANPFAEMDESGDSEGDSPKSSGRTGGSIKWGDVETIEILGGDHWEVPISESSGLGFDPKKVPLPKKSHFFENIHPLAINLSAKKVALGYSTSFGVDAPYSRIVIGDLTTGKMVSSENTQSLMKPLCLLDDGTTILMGGTDDKGDGPDVIQEWTLKGKKIAKGNTWIPFEADLDVKTQGGGGNREAAHVAFAVPLKSNLVLMCSRKGHMACFDMSTKTPKWHAALGEAPAAGFNADNSLIAFPNSNKIVVLKTDTGELVGQISIQDKGHLPWPKVAFSPSGKKIGLAAWDRVLILDVEKKEWIQEMSFPGTNVGNAFAFPDEDHVLFDNRTLIHWPTRIQLWTILESHTTAVHGDVAFLCCNTDAGGILFPTKLPTTTAKEKLVAAQKQSDLFVVRPGAAMGVNINGVPQQYQAEVKAGIEKAIEAIGCKISPNAEVQVVAGITGPKQEAVSYHMSGAHVVQSYTSSLAIQYKGQTIWQSGGTNIPGMIMLSRDETMESYLAKASASPNLSFFQQVKFPEFLQKPSPAGNGNTQTLSTIGASTLTANGLQ